MKIFAQLKEYRYMQYLCVLISTLLQASLSMASSWISPVLPLLTSIETPLEAPLTKIEESWLVSGEKLGAMIGCVLAAILTDKIGRKRMLSLAALPLFVAMLATAFNKIVVVLIVLRIVIGLSTGITFVVLPLYIGEVSEKDIRGRLSTMMMILSTLGSVIVYSIGPFISFAALSITCSIFPIVFLCLFMFMPETPFHLVKKGETDSAMNSLRLLSQKHASEDALQVRIQEIGSFIAKDNENKVYLKDLFVNKLYRKAFLIVLTLRCLLGLSGIHVISSYLQKIIQSSGSSVSPELSSVIFGVIKLPSALIAAFLVDKLGRRPLLIVSTIGCAVTLTAEGLYFYFNETMNIATMSWVPTTGLSIYLLSVYFGIDIIPIIALGEVFTINAKSLASSCVMIVGFALSFLLLQVFKPASDALGVYTVFWFFAGCCILGCLFAIFILPETKGKSFSEIQELLSQNKRK